MEIRPNFVHVFAPGKGASMNATLCEGHNTRPHTQQHRVKTTIPTGEKHQHSSSTINTAGDEEEETID